MAAAKQQPLPAILIANDLLDGFVVFRAANGWSPDPREAVVAKDAQAAALLSEQAAAGIARQEVVDAYLIDVTLDENGVMTPNHFRERIKIKGPSVRKDLGKQAEFKTA
jgi:hypothetical protein